jgi:hypothetical protein
LSAQACGARRLTLVRLLAASAAGLTAALAARTARARSEQRFADVVGVKVRAAGGDRFDFDVTVSSPYDNPTRYADAFRVSTLAGAVLGERILLHDHQGEQPFTRDLHGVAVPPSIRVVVVQARDRRYGYGGKTFQIALPGR